jgi:hypothetical protein
MERSSLAAVALTVLLVTAGCSGVLGGDGSTSPASSMPADDDAANAVPGVENGQVTNATALLAAHDRGLVAAGFENEVRVNATVIQQDQVADVTRRQQTIVEAGRDEYQYRTFNGNNGGFVRFDHWGNESVWVTRGQLGNTTRYQVRDRTPATGSLTGTALLRNYINNSNATAVEVQRKNGSTLTTFETTTLPGTANALPANASNVRAYRTRFTVDSQGRIHGFVAQGTYDLRGEPRTFEIRYNLVRLDNPSVTQPDWAGEALRNGSS